MAERPVDELSFSVIAEGSVSVHFLPVHVAHIKHLTIAATVVRVS